jgi:hypothetical protein
MGCDDSLGNLEDFCQMLAVSTQALQALLPALEAQAEGLAAIEPDLGEEIRGATSDADALEHEVEDGGGRAAKAVGELDQAARDLRQRVGAVASAAAELDTTSTADVGAKETMLEDHFEELQAEGFARLLGDLGQERADFEGWWARAEVELDAFEQSFGKAEETLNAEESHTRSDFETAVSEMGVLADRVASLELESGGSALYVVEFTVPEELREQLKEHAQGRVDAITDWEGELDDEAAALHTSAATLAETAGNTVKAETGRLTEGLDALQRELDLVELEVTQADADLAAARPALDEASRQVAGIPETEERIRLIQQVVAAMDIP